MEITLKFGFYRCIFYNTTTLELRVGRLIGFILYQRAHMTSVATHNWNACQSQNIMHITLACFFVNNFGLFDEILNYQWECGTFRSKIKVSRFHLGPINNKNQLLIWRFWMRFFLKSLCSTELPTTYNVYSAFER